MTRVFGFVAGPEKVAMMGRVLDAYCNQAGIMNAADREDVAVKIIALFEYGVDTEDGLMAALLDNRLRRTG